MRTFGNCWRVERCFQGWGQNWVRVRGSGGQNWLSGGSSTQTHGPNLNTKPESSVKKNLNKNTNKWPTKQQRGPPVATSSPSGRSKVRATWAGFTTNCSRINIFSLSQIYQHCKKIEYSAGFGTMATRSSSFKFGLFGLLRRGSNKTQKRYFSEPVSWVPTAAATVPNERWWRKENQRLLFGLQIK